MFHKELASLIPLVTEKRSLVTSLTTVLVDAKEKTITCTDLDMMATISKCPITGKGKILVDAYTLQGIAKGTKKAFSMAMDKDDKGNQVLVVESDGDTYKLPATIPVEDFPIFMPLDINTTADGIPVDLFKVVFCASTEESRYYLNGVHLNADKEGFYSVATDGHRMAKRQCISHINGKGFDRDNNIIVPIKAVKAIRKLFTDEITICLLGAKDAITQCQVQKNNITIYAKLIDGKFPDYERVIPPISPANVHIQVDGKEMARLCGKAAIVSDSHNTQAHLFGGNTGYWLRIEGNKSTVEKKLSEVPSNKTFEVGFSADYMSDIIDNMDAKEFSMQIIAPDSPIRMGQNDNLYVLMPMRLSK